jgi:hypothetical protein
VEPFQVRLNRTFPTEPVPTERNNFNLHSIPHPIQQYQTRNPMLPSSHNLPKKLGILGRQASLPVTRVDPRNECPNKVNSTTSTKPTRPLRLLHPAGQAMCFRLQTCRTHRRHLQCRSRAQTLDLPIRKPFSHWQRKRMRWRDGQWVEQGWHLMDSHLDDLIIVNLNLLFTDQRTPATMDSREWDQGTDVICLARAHLAEVTI